MSKNPWNPADYVAVGPQCLIVGWGRTKAAAQSATIENGFHSAVIVHSMLICNTELEVYKKGEEGK